MEERIMKKLVVLLVVGIMVLALAAPVFAARPDHPPTPEQSVNVAPAQAAGGLHRACGNTSGIANHVLLFRVGPGPHGK